MLLISYVFLPKSSKRRYYQESPLIVKPGTITKTLFCFASLAPNTVAFADRADMQEAYKRQLRNNNVFFRGAPLYHVIPVKDTVTYSASFESYDVTIGPDKDRGSSDNIDNHYLKLSGYSLAPLISLQAKDFGLGFLAEKGYRRSLYRQDMPTSFYETQSRMDYSGIGLYAYAVPTISGMPKMVSTTFIVGSKFLNVVHQTAEPKNDRDQTSQFTRYRYTVQKTSAGASITMRLAKRVAVIPWYDYTWVRLGAIKNGSGDDTSPGSDTMIDDQNLFWQAEPPQRFGLDVAAVLGRFDVNFGGVLGMIGGMNQGSDRIVDRSFTVNVSFSMKSK